MEVSEAITWSVLLGLSSFAMWGGIVLVARSSFPIKRYEVTRFEQWLAMIPTKLVRWFAHPIPAVDSLGARNWNNLSARHSEKLRIASMANDALFVVPWTLAVLVAVSGICQWALVLIPSLASNTRLSEIFLSSAVAFLFFFPVVATHEVRDSRWRARAPFEWQFIAAAIWLIDASDAARHGPLNAGTKLNSYHLWRLEASMFNRFGHSRRATSPSRKLAEEAWLSMIRPLFRDAAILQLGPYGRAEWQSIRALVEDAAATITQAAAPKRRWNFLSGNELPSAAQQADPPTPLQQPSDAKTVIVMVLLTSVISFALWWVSETLFNPQSLRDLLAQIKASPATAMGILVSTLAMIATAGQFIVSYASLVRLRKHA